MTRRVYWTELPEAPGGIALVKKPRAVPYLDEDCRAFASAGLTGIVSLLEPAEASAIGLAEQGHYCAAAGLSFVQLPVPDHHVPSDIEGFDACSADLAEVIAGGGRLGFHCFATLGRSPMLAACVMIRLGVDAETALARLSAARCVPVPETPEQRSFVLDRTARNLLTRSVRRASGWPGRN